jgi:addiction module RelE/StbE family toxin
VVEIVYSPKAKEDLEQIGDYIAETLKSPLAALNIVRKIQHSINQLSEFPKIGSSLSSVTYVDFGYRFLVCGNYLVFYHNRTTSVHIDRILYSRRDYFSILFGSLDE